MSDRESGKSGCLRWLGWGCGCLVACLVLLAIAVWVGRDLIRQSDWFQEFDRFADRSKREVTSALELRDQLLAVYPAESISIGFRISSGIQSSRIIAVTILNPTFAVPDGEDGLPVAEEIARFVAARHPSIADMDSVVIEVHRATGSFSSEQTYEFPVAELLADLPTAH